MPRPKKPSADLAKRREIYAPQAVWEKAGRLAKAAGVSISAYLLRDVVEVQQSSAVVDLLEELQAMRRELAHVSQALQTQGNPTVIKVHMDLVTIDRRLVRLAESLAL